jgi:hypothetical protein
MLIAGVLFGNLLLLVFAIFLSKRRRKNRYFAVAPWIIVGNWLGCTLIIVARLAAAFSSFGTAAPDARAAALAHGIAMAFYWVVVANVVSALIFVYLIAIAIIFRDRKPADPAS